MFGCDHNRLDSGSFQSDQRHEEYYEMKSKTCGDPSRLFPNAAIPEQVDEYLNILIDIAEILEIDAIKFSTCSEAISRLSSEELSLRKSSLHLGRAEEELLAHLASAQHEEALIRSWTETLRTEHFGESSVGALERRKAALLTKAREYQAELDALMPQLPSEPAITVSQLAARVRQLKSTEKALKAKRAKVQAFQGLPPNLELARHELRRARDEQMQLIQLRERLLERMASGVS